MRRDSATPPRRRPPPAPQSHPRPQVRRTPRPPPWSPSHPAPPTTTSRTCPPPTPRKDARRPSKSKPAKLYSSFILCISMENTKVYSQLSVANPNRGSVSLQIDLDDPRAAGRRPGARGAHL